VADVLTLDFETRSPVSLKDVGAYRYFEHPDTRPLCVAASFNGRLGVFTDFANMPSWFLDALADENVEVHAHNSTIERLCIREICGPKFGWPVPKGKRYRCSAARARRLALPGKLEKLGPAIGLPDEALKDKEGHRVMLRLMKPLPRRANSPPGFQYDDDPAKHIRLQEYCKRDVVSEEAAEARMLPMTPEEIEYYHFTERLNDRGVRIDVRLVKRLVHRALEAATELDEEICRRTGGAVQRVTNVAQIKQWVYDETGEVLTTLRKEDMEGLIGGGVDILGDPVVSRLPKRVVRVLQLRQEGAKSSISKLLKILDRVCRDGRLRGEFVYHGASTGRYTSMGVQLQNLIRDCLKDFEGEIKALDTFTLEKITLAIRGCFIPAEGHVFVDADYNAIEARGVAWLAGCEKLVRVFRENGDPYCQMGSVIYRREITAADEWERFVGKQTILGCGYGMGWQKFFDQCVKFGKPVDEETATRSVTAYRETYPEIPALWRDMEDAAIAAVKNPGQTFGIPSGLVKFRVLNGYLQMALPSGRRLFYKDPLVVRRMKFGRMRDVLTFMGIHPKTKQWARETTWGGTLTENAVQAISRDVLFRAMLTLDRMGIPLVLSVHDQIVAEVLKVDGDWACRQVKRVMEAIPEWARGFPIKTTPKLALRFGK
jgi:DNA polymerase